MFLFVVVLGSGPPHTPPSVLLLKEVPVCATEILAVLGKAVIV